MNALDVDIPALDDYTSTIYSGIIDNATEQLNALKEAEEEARKAAEEAAKQAARNSARRSSGGGRSSSRSSTDSDTDSSSDKTIDIAGLFGGNAAKTEDDESQQTTTVQAKKAAGNTKKTGGKKTSNAAKTTGAKKTTNTNKVAGSNAKTRTVTTPASSYLTGQTQTTEAPYAAAQQTQNSARRTATRASNTERTNDNTDTQYWSAAARAAANSGDNEAAYQVVNNYLEQNENARRLWNLDGRTARGSRAQTEARNRMTEQELQTYDQMRELYNSYGPLWSAAHRVGSDLTGLAQQIGGSFVTLGESIVPAIVDAADQVAAQSVINELVRRGDAFEQDESGNMVATPEMQRAQQDYERGLANTVSLDPENSLGLQLYNAGAENLANAQLGLDDGARFGVNLANAVIGNAPTMAAAAIPGVGPAISLGLAGAQAAGGRTAELSNEGAGASEALGRGLLSGGIEAATEILPVGSWVNILNTSQGRSVARSILQQMGSEATEEGVSYLANTVADMAAQDPNAQFSLEELAQNMVMGGLSGGIYGGAGQFIGNRVNPAYRTEFGGTQNIAREAGAEVPQTAPLGLDDTFAAPQNQAATAQQNAVPALDMDVQTQYNAVNNVQGGAPNGTEANPDLGGNVPANLETGNPGGAGAERQPAVPGGTSAGENGAARGSAAQETVNYAQRAQDVTGRDRRSQYTRSLQSLYERMAGGDMDAAAIDSEIDNIARGIVREADYTVEADPAQQELRNYLRNTRIYVNPQNVSEILNATGLRSVSQYNIQNGLNLTTNPDGAVPLDTALQELSGMNVGYAGDGASPVDDLMQIAPRPQQQVDSDLLQANIDYTKEIIRDNFSGMAAPTFEEWLAQNNVSNEWGDAPDYIQRVADRYGIEHRVESYDDDFGFDSLPEVNPQGESISGPPDVSIGAMRNPFDRQVVPSQTNMIDTIDMLNLRPEDIEAQGGLRQFTHERVSHAEQQYNADRIFETETMPEVEARISEKPDWNDEDITLAGRIQQEYDRQLASMDRNSQEYRDLLAQKQHFVGKVAQHTTGIGRALEAAKQYTTPEKVQIQAQQTVDKAIEGLENDNRQGPQFKQDSERVKDAVNNAESEADAAAEQEASNQIGTLWRDNLVDPASRLFRRIRNYSSDVNARPQTVEQAATNELVNQLFQTAKESPLQRGRRAQRATPTPIEQLRLALNNQSTYREVWNRTKNALMTQYADDPNMLGRLFDFFANESEGRLYSNKTVARAITQVLAQNNTTMQQIARQSAFGNTQAVDGFINEVVSQVNPPAEYEPTFRDTLRQTLTEDSRYQNALWNERTGSADQAVLREVAKQIGVNFRDLVKQSNRSRFEIGRQLSGLIVEELGISGELADTVSNNIMDAYYTALSDAAEKNLNQMFRRQSNSQRTAQDQFLNLLRMGVYDDQSVKNYVATKYGIEPLTPEQSQQILELAEQAEALPENSQARVNLENQIAGIATGQIKSSFKDKWDAWRYVAMLLNLRTNERNMAGNIAMGLNARAKDTVLGLIEGTVDNVLRATGHQGIQRTTSVMNPLSARTRQLMGAAFTDADTNAYRRLTSSSEMFNLTRDARRNRRIFNNSALNVMSNASDAALSGADYAGTAGFVDALGALDNKTAQNISNWVKNGVESLGEKGFVGVSGLRNNYARSLASFLNANGADASIFQATDQASTDLLNQAREWAIQQALVNTYHQESKIGDKISQFKAGLKDGGPAGQAGYMIAEGLLPFVKTPINVAKNAVNYSPIGIMRSLVELGDTAVKTAQGKATADYAVNRGLDHLAQGLTGTGIVLLGYMLAKNGLLVGGMDDEEEQEALLTGDQEYSIRLPDKNGNFTSYTVDWLSAWAMPAFVGAEIAKLEDEGVDDDNLVNTLASSATSILEPLLSMSFMQGVNDMFSSAGYSDTPVYSVGFDLATNYLTQGIPSLSGQIARTVDPYRRDSSNNGQTGLAGDLNYFLSSTANRIPFLSEQNEPHIDIWGNAEENDGGDYLGRAINNMLSPGYVGRSRDTAVDNYIEELYDVTGNAAVLPSEAAYTVSVKMDDATRRLNAEERTAYQTARGQTSYNILDELLDNNAFQSLSDEDQADIVSDVYSLANKVGYAAAVPNYTSDDKLYGVYLEDGIDGAINRLLTDVAVSNAKDAAGEDASFGNAETWNAMQDLGLDDVSLVDTYLAKASDSVSERIADLVGPEGVIAYRDAYDGADRDGNGSVSKTELAIALSNSGASDDVAFRTYMATQTTTSDDGEQSTDEKAASAYQQFGASGGMDWLRYYSAYSVAKEQAQAQAKAAGESADLKGLAESLLNQMGLSEEQKRAFFSLTNSSWKGNPF